MTARAAKTVGEGESNGKGLRGLAINVLAEAHLPGIMARERPDCPAIQQKRQNRMLGSWLESSERPMVVSGQGLSRKSRFSSPFRNGLASESEQEYRASRKKT